RERFARLVEGLLDAPARPHQECVDVRPRVAVRSVSKGLKTVLVPVQVHNQGTHALVPDGPGRTVLHCDVLNGTGQPGEESASQAPLPGLLLPGRTLTLAVPVPVPPAVGTYEMRFRAEGAKALPGRPEQPAASPPGSTLRLTVAEDATHADVGCCTPLLETVEAELAEAQRRQRLPDDYTDVTEGVFAKWKRRIKSKLLGNF